MVDTPTDEIEEPAAAEKPSAGNRYRLFDDDAGDYRIYEIVPKEQKLPKGALVPIPTVPGFPSSAKARQFITNSGDLLKGKQLLVLKGLQICSIKVETLTIVRPSWKPRRAISGPAVTEAAGT